MEDNNPHCVNTPDNSPINSSSREPSKTSTTSPDSQTGGVDVPLGGSYKFSDRKISIVSLSEGSMTRSRRSRLQKQPELQGSAEAPDKGSLTPAMRKKYLQELFLNHKSHTGLSRILSIKSTSQWSRDGEDAGGNTLEDPSIGASLWAMDPLEHAWMLSIVDGNYDTMVDFLAEDPSLLTRKDFVSGYTALHWLAKNGKHEILIKLLRRAEKEGSPVNVNLKGSGGQTPLHVAAMHNQYMVVKILVGAFGANIDAMDYSGRRAWQYLRDRAPVEMKELLGAWDDEHRYCQLNVNNNCAGPEVSTVQESPRNTDEVDYLSRRTGRWPFGSFRKLLSPFFSGGKK